ncbi:hypothetical protein NEMIN01_1070 [Nematocida minor]|uniref:uncharacterized protein n=1 Tax=Nematocida minor TaxID=1912983 RepID=UPI0022201C0F|nr:uncharacterized protein NEMIN01_1070 [Nematocida minor]KAI5190532.1 hypothetical protein NEMIN01_1070 [Nematocida minor]
MTITKQPETAPIILEENTTQLQDQQKSFTQKVIQSIHDFINGSNLSILYAALLILANGFLFSFLLESIDLTLRNILRILAINQLKDSSRFTWFVNVITYGMYFVINIPAMLYVRRQVKLPKILDGKITLDSLRTIELLTYGLIFISVPLIKEFALGATLEYFSSFYYYKQAVKVASIVSWIVLAFEGWGILRNTERYTFYQTKNESLLVFSANVAYALLLLVILAGFVYIKLMNYATGNIMVGL